MFTREQAGRPLQAGHGAVFWVDIPYVPENEDEAQTEPAAIPTRSLEQRPQSSPSQQPGVSTIPLRLLLVEDSIMIQVRRIQTLWPEYECKYKAHHADTYACKPDLANAAHLLFRQHRLECSSLPAQPLHLSCCLALHRPGHDSLSAKFALAPTGLTHGSLPLSPLTTRS